MNVISCHIDNINTFQSQLSRIVFIVVESAKPTMYTLKNTILLT